MATQDEQVKELNGHIARIAAGVQGYREEVAATNSRVSALEQELAARGGITGTQTASRGAIGQKLQAALSDSASFEHIRAWNEGTARLELPDLPLAALINEGKGSGSVMPTRPDYAGIVGQVVPQPRLLQFLNTRQVHADSVEFVQLATANDAGYQEDEGAEKAELTFEGTKRKSHIATIAGWTSASRQVLGDNESLQQVIEQVMTAKLLNKLTYEIINGTGSDSDGDWKISGLLVEGATMALPTMTSFADRIGEAVTRQQKLGFAPGVIAVHPTDWLTYISTAKDNEQRYLFGAPTMPVPPALWNLPVALEASVPQGHALVIDPAFVTVLDRQQPTILISNSHKDYFTKNLIAILAEMRDGLEVLDTGAVMIVEPTST